MPFINVKTNTPVPANKAEAIKAALGQAITAIPGKSEHWLMVGIEPEQLLWFQGSDAPAAMVEVSVFGSASPSACDEMTSRVCSILSDELGIAGNRIYVKYAATDQWGWNGSNF
jgi:phenylpyruvate tautomerase PptA (4-oxalocrotonate tautomerase family)